MTSSLDELRQRQWLWKGSTIPAADGRRHSSGHAGLDRYLSGGWPTSGVIELQPTQFGIGELRLILPLLHHLATQEPEGLQVWIDPPARLTPDALPTPRFSPFLILRPPHPKDALWAAEQVLRSGHCRYLVLWHTGLNPAQAKRLQVAAHGQNTLAFVISLPKPLHRALALRMRVSLQATAQGVRLEVPKQQQGWPLPPFELDLHDDSSVLYPRRPASGLAGFGPCPCPGPADAAND
jgi:protein ImuA